MDREKIILAYDRQTGSVYTKTIYGEQYLCYLNPSDDNIIIESVTDLSEVNTKLDFIISKVTI